MAVEIREEDYRNFGRCIFMTNGLVTLGATLEVGPRVIWFGLNGRENVLLEDTERRFSENVDGFGVWYTYGGHRLWCAPETKPETYYPDNAPVSCRFEGDTLELISPVTAFGKRYSLRVRMDSGSPEVELTQRIENLSQEPREFAAWSVTALRPGGVCVIPISQEKTGFLPNRVVSLWDYSDLYDSRFRLSNDQAVVRQDSSVKKPFKAGFNVEDGFASYAVEGQIFMKRFEGYGKVRYPDFSCNVEVYTNELFLECELLGELRSYGPGETAELRERWQLYDGAQCQGASAEDIKRLIS